ncbi:protein NRT1/ PTR FAMILY 7.2 isoform X1 [Cryptomeria japonica]|uniref:protein NRT1/ PTR FAMILY 7.2 isoform X1 n=1 Tax=Cryptomeria japonica TaxID=3369 RepID=UPI0025AC67B2|nr:protein NRT1/ PTR FAMILY 7.2 isoform X1 [Cryptomeria japonica]
MEASTHHHQLADSKMDKTSEYPSKKINKHKGMELNVHKSSVPYTMEEENLKYTKDGTVDRFGRPVLKAKSGGWKSAILILVNQGFATLAFFGVGVNLVLFLTRVLKQNNASAANNVSKWTGTVYMFSLVGAFLSDSYMGRFRTCASFLCIFVGGLVLLALSSQLLLLKPSGCGDGTLNCENGTPAAVGLFYLSIYLVALGNGGYQPSIATFGADQFDEEDETEAKLKVAFFSWFYLAFNLGSLFSNTVLGYFENNGMWPLGFWVSALAAMISMVVFLFGTPRYRHHIPGGNPLPRIGQVFVAAIRKNRFKLPSDAEELHELSSKHSAINGSRKILHSAGFRFLDKAAIETGDDKVEGNPKNPWRLCTVTQVEEVKCILRLLPIWLCTIIYSVVFTQMASLFVEQGAAMDTSLGNFNVPPAAMSMFDIFSVVIWIIVYRRALVPLGFKISGNPKGLTELQRMGVGLILGMLAMVTAGLVEVYRLKAASSKSHNTSSLSIFWQIPQYALIGASEVFMYVGQLEFFNNQSPDALRSFGSALCMTSMSLGNYVSSLLVTIVMDITKRENSPGWIPANLNHGHMDLFYFLLAGLTFIDFIAYVLCARGYRCVTFDKMCEQDEEQEIK